MWPRTGQEPTSARRSTTVRSWTPDGAKLLSRRVLNGEPELLELIGGALTKAPPSTPPIATCLKQTTLYKIE